MAAQHSIKSLSFLRVSWVVGFPHKTTQEPITCEYIFVPLYLMLVLRVSEKINPMSFASLRFAANNATPTRTRGLMMSVWNGDVITTSFMCTCVAHQKQIISDLYVSSLIFVKLMTRFRLIDCQGNATRGLRPWHHGIIRPASARVSATALICILIRC